MHKAWIPMLLLTTACSSVSSGPTADLERQIDELKARVVALQQQAAVDKVELGALSSRLEALEARLQGEAEGERTSRGIGEEDLVPRLGEVEIEESDLEELPVVDPVGERQSARPAAEASAEGLSAAAQERYDRGYTLHHQGRYFEAEEAFAAFLLDHDDSDLADNALYWIGESRVGRNELQSALAAFEETVRQHPRGNKAPDALYKIGVLLERLGDVSGARESYLRLISDYPLSPLTDQAQARLSRL